MERAGSIALGPRGQTEADRTRRSRPPSYTADDLSPSGRRSTDEQTPSLQNGLDETTALRDGSPAALSRHSEPENIEANVLEKDTTAIKRSKFTMHWTEILACFLASASLIATFGTLYPYEGKPLPRWPFSIGVNTLLATYTVILKAAISFLASQGIALQKWHWYHQRERPLSDLALFDEATRGPMGAIKLLWRLSSWRNLPRGLGCALVVLMLFVDPFTQQVLQYTDCSVSSGDAATLMRTNVFGGADIASQQALTEGEEDAVRVGIAGSGPRVDFKCPSGNCSFAPYNTIGYCSSCVNINAPVNLNDQTAATYASAGPGAITFGNFHQNLSALEAFNNGTYRISVEMPAHLVDQINPGFWEQNQPSGCDDPAKNNTWRCHGYGVASCQLYPCVRTLSAVVQDGVATEVLAAGTPTPSSQFGAGGFDTGEDYYSTIDANCLSDADISMLNANGFSSQSKDGWLPYELTGYVGSNRTLSTAVLKGKNYNAMIMVAFERHMQQRGCLYAMNSDLNSALLKYLATDWPGNLTGYMNSFGGPISNIQGPEILEVLYNSGNASFERTQSVFENISTSLTDFMRLQPGNWSYMPKDMSNLTAPTMGTMSYEKSCIAVRWPWLSVPALVVVGTLAYFAAVLHTRRSLEEDVASWLSSPLPLLLYGLDSNVLMTGGSQHLEAIEKRAGQVIIELDADKDGINRLEVKQADGEPGSQYLP